MISTENKKALKHLVVWLIALVAVPLTVIVGITVFGAKRYAFISAAVALLSVLPFFLAFEKKSRDQREPLRLSVIAVITAISIVSRIAFSFTPSFKPVTAVVIIAGAFLGGEAGFMCGSLTALISNFYFGQGAFTPFQMLAWGLIGFFAGVLGRTLRKHVSILLIYGAMTGVAFSLILDVWSTIWFDGYFNFDRYLVQIVAAAPMTVSYAVSNVIFLIVLAAPFGKRLERIKTKYGL